MTGQASHLNASARGSAISRRRFLGTGGAGLGALTLGAGSFGALTVGNFFASRAADLQREGLSCILLWMQGGPSQLETFDPKPEHENGGPTGVISTKVSGVQIAEHWNEVATVMDQRCQPLRQRWR